MCLGFLAAACSTNNELVSPEAAAVLQEDCVIEPGDVCRITVFGHEHLSRELEVDSSGRIALPLIRRMERSLNGLTCDEAEQLIYEWLVSPSEFLPAPKSEEVSVECFGYPPVYIIEGDGKPVPYHYRRGMRVGLIIAMAGRFTYRSVDDECVAIITRDGKRKCAGPEALLMPGDVIELQERFSLPRLDRCPHLLFTALKCI